MRAPRKAALRWASLSLVFMSSFAWPADLTIPNTFVSGTPATAADVNANFSATATAVNSKQDRVVGTCPAGQSIRAVNQDGSVVCQSFAFFGGDGSAGNLTVSASQDWNSVPPLNPNFANITINAGQVLTVPAGTTIRCSGNFLNLGIINVSNGVRKNATGFTTNFDVSSQGAAIGIAYPGDSLGAASRPDWHNDFTGTAVAVDGGLGGIGIPRAMVVTSFNSFRIGGGSGSGHATGSGGGGLVKIYCRGGVTNSGIINANGGGGAAAAGGGGGGIVILASETSVDGSLGTINATGGAGGSGGSGWGGRGGGGGGGIVVFVSPTIVSTGTVDVSGGAAGTGGTDPATTNVRIGGGGGGASGGNGGNGGNIASNSVLGAAQAGTAGYAVSTPVAPSTLMH